MTDKDFKRNLRNFSKMNVSEYWLISAPGDRTCQETWDRLNQVRVVFLIEMIDFELNPFNNF